jgi:hypothetical protein
LRRVHPEVVSKSKKKKKKKSSAASGEEAGVSPNVQPTPDNGSTSDSAILSNDPTVTVCVSELELRDLHGELPGDSGEQPSPTSSKPISE